jgi:hypothetical protein
VEDVKSANGLTTCQTQGELLVSRDQKLNAIALKDNLLTHTLVKSAQVDMSQIQTTKSNV